MLFVMGPRQVGKTTIAQSLQEDWPAFTYFTWDSEEDQELILLGGREVARQQKLGKNDREPPLLIFDEIHKYENWKNFLKGLYDAYPFMAHILVTGSARLDVYQKGGDSLMGRYFRYRVHPFTVRELAEPTVVPLALRPDPISIDEEQFQALWRFGGFPDPFLRGNEQYHAQWLLLRDQQLFRDDVRDLTKVREISQLQLLAKLLRRQTGALTSHASLAKKVKASHTTIASWLQLLQSVYYSFEVRPWTKNITRSLIKEPKYYMVDWSSIEDPAIRAENMVACHLLKAVHFWTDCGMGKFDLCYIRDKEKREVDFIVTRNDSPYLLVEVKLRNSLHVSSSLKYFQQQLDAPYALQVVFEMPNTQQTCFIDRTPRVVPARAFLSQLA